MNDSPAIVDDKVSEGIRNTRQALLNDMPGMAEQYTDAVVADGSPGAYRDWFATVSKVVPGVVADPKSQYDNLRTISFSFGDSFTTQLLPSPPAEVIEIIEDAVLTQPKPTGPTVQNKKDAANMMLALARDLASLPLNPSPPEPQDEFDDLFPDDLSRDYE